MLHVVRLAAPPSEATTLAWRFVTSIAGILRSSMVEVDSRWRCRQVWFWSMWRCSTMVTLSGVATFHWGWSENLIGAQCMACIGLGDRTVIVSINLVCISAARFKVPFWWKQSSRFLLSKHANYRAIGSYLFRRIRNLVATWMQTIRTPSTNESAARS